ncbi:MAG: methyltransferase domain-containing protein [Victivallales bacterium]|jgi:tRNA (guanine-N7-)-methyltransferase|nr:methyltransferase domain-containing protein [Victivallales bacterium]
MPFNPMDKHPEDAQIRFCTGVWELYDSAELPPKSEIELDLGCGVGSYTALLAQKYPERKILAADVMLGRLRKLVKRTVRMKIGNMTILRSEARFLVAVMLPDNSIDRLHLLCPDPWPKDRHSGHRLLTSDFVSQLHRVLKESGVFHFSSDDEPYYAAVRRVLASSGLFVEEPGAIADLSGIKSDFELRWNEEGKVVRHIAYRKIPRPAHIGGH